MELDYENAPLEAPVEQAEESGLPQTIPLDPGKLIDQLMRRYGAQNQQQVWENAQLATENDALKTLLAEAQNERAEDASTIAALAQREDFLLGKLDESAKRELQLERVIDELRSPTGIDGMTAEAVSSADDPQEVDGFLAMASGRPGLGGDPAPAES